MGQSSASNFEASKKIFKTGSVYAVADNLTVTGTVNGRTSEITVDTGSNISIVRPDVLAAANQKLIESVDSCLRMVTEEDAAIQPVAAGHWVFGSASRTLGCRHS